MQEKDFRVRAGETFHPVVRWGTGVLTSKAISGITQAAPAAITATAHGLPDGWPCAAVGVQGMTEINSDFPPVTWHASSVPDANTVLLADTSSADFSAYVVGGFLVYDTPQDLSACTFTLSIYDVPDHSDTALITLTGGSGITVDNTAKTIKPLLQTAGLAWTTGYYRLDATDGFGVVTELLRGTLYIDP